MPIKTLTETNVTTVCGLCEHERVVNLNTIELGLDRGEEPDLDAIYMPACPTCGSVEIFQRNWDEIPAAFVGSAFDEQRRAVNALAQRLRTMGRVNAGVASIINAETAEPGDIVAAAQLQGQGHSPKMVQPEKGRAMWAAKQAGKDNVHPSRR